MIYLTTNEFCLAIGISRSTFYMGVFNHTHLSKPIKSGSRYIRYRDTNLATYCEAMSVSIQYNSINGEFQ